MTEPLHTFDEAAALLGISVKTLREHVSLGRIRSIVVGGGKARKHRRFTDKNIQSFIEKQKVRETPICQSTNQKIPFSITPALNSTVIAFTSLQKPGAKKTLKK